MGPQGAARAPTDTNLRPQIVAAIIGAVTRPIEERLLRFGAPKAGIRSLRGSQPTSEHVRYLDLMVRTPTGPDAVVEMDGEPLAYVLDADHSDVSLDALQRSLVFRADAPYLIELRPGQLRVFSLGPGALADSTPSPSLTVSDDDPSALTTFVRLFHAPPDEHTSLPASTVHDRLFDLLSQSVDQLIGSGLETGDALSLAGRAMFMRFLHDRNILDDDHWKDVARRATRPEYFFTTSRNAAATCRWIDTTFNGDFLPLSFKPTATAFDGCHSEVFETLSGIMRCDHQRQLNFDWENVDFSSVPAGLLSQVYEHLAEYHQPTRRKKKGIYYTPRRIADYMVAETLAGLRAEFGEDHLSSIKVLDPAVGGGVFLVAFLRELVSAQWRRTKRPPTSTQIRRILYHQLTGFDVAEPALRLTALSLYLTALELDPSPRPLSALRFEPLLGKVLHDVTEANATEGADLRGSLRPLPNHSGKYDVVIGNPPWTALSSSLPRHIERDLTTMLADQGLDVRVALPDKVPDVAFLWRSLDWAKPGGRISLVVAARLFFKQSDRGIQARNDLLGAIELTGVLNGAELRRTDVWPKVTAPFALVFCRNRRPSQTSAFYFVSPMAETHMNIQGRFRIDHQDAQPIATAALVEEPRLLKTLFRGTGLDLELVHRIEKHATARLGLWWKEAGLSHGQGYQVGTSEKEEASELNGLPDLGSEPLTSPVVKTKRLPRFELSRVHRRRRPEIYKGPLVIHRKSPPSGTDWFAAVANKSVAYRESFYGWSTAGHDSPRALARYLFLLLNSNICLWFLLVTSGEFGVERESVHVLDLENLPFVPPESMAESVWAEVDQVFEACCAAANPRVADAWIARVFGLSSWDCTTIADTLATRLPFSKIKGRSEQRPSRDTCEKFCHVLASILDASLTNIETTLDWQPGSLWQRIAVSSGTRKTEPVFESDVIELADHIGASRILDQRQEHGALAVYILAQERYWTPSRARLLALEIIDEHWSVFVD